MPVYELGSLRPVFGKDVFVAPNATVIGDVVLGDQASVWFGAVLRGDMYPIRIGARTNIQDNAVVHITADKAKTTLGDDVTVGHAAIVHGCTIGSRCLVGMGSIVLDGAVIEDECFLAAGTLVPPGMRVPARSMVMGRPGKIVRALREAELDDIRSASIHYVEYAREFVRSLRLIDFPEKS